MHDDGVTLVQPFGHIQSKLAVGYLKKLHCPVRMKNRKAQCLFVD